MISLPEVFSRGVLATARHWRVLLPLYLVGLLLGLAQTWPLLAAPGAFYSPLLGALARGDASIVDLFLASPSAAGATTGLWAVAALLLGALFSLAYNFFSGGIVAAYLGDSSSGEVGATANIPRFWPACWRWLLSFVGLGLLLVILALIALGLASALGLLLGVGGATVASALLLALINTLGEYARALAVWRGRRSPFALLGLALGFARRNFLGVLGLALLGVLLHAGVAALYLALARGLSGSPALILAQQVAVLAWLLVKLLRLAWAASYVRLEADARPPAVWYDTGAALL